MSEKIELIDAKDLPVTEEEDVTVLCVGADGEMKRRDAGSFGMKASDLAELPTTEAEEVDVICVDAEGNLCRKSSASFGGGGLFAVNIALGDDNWVAPSSVTFDRTYEEIKDAMDKGCVVIGLITNPLFRGGEDGYKYTSFYLRHAFPIYGKQQLSDRIFFLTTTEMATCYYISSNGETGCEIDA